MEPIRIRPFRFTVYMGGTGLFSGSGISVLVGVLSGHSRLDETTAVGLGAVLICLAILCAFGAWRHRKGEIYFI